MPRTISIRIATIAVAIASSALLGATSRKAFDPLESVPSGAVAVVTVGDPASLLTNSVAFLRNAGLDGPADQLAGLVESALSSDVSERARAFMRAVDPSRRFVAAVYPAGGLEAGEAAPFSLLAFIPMKSVLSPAEAEGLSASIERLMSDEAGSISVATDYPGYLVVMTSGGSIPAYGYGATMNLARLASGPAASVVAWVDPLEGSRYLDSLPGGLGSLLSGPDSELEDEYPYEFDDALEGELEDWPDEGSPDGEPGGPLDNAGVVEEWPEEAADELEAGVADNVVVDNATDNSTDNVVDSGTDNPGDIVIDGTDEGDYGYAEDFSWDDDERDGGDDSGEKVLQQLTAVKDAMRDGLAELSGVRLSLVVQRDRAWLRAGAEARSGGRLAALAGRAAAGDASIPYLSYCESDALVSVAWSTPYDWSLPLLEAVYGLILPDEGLAAASMASMRAYAAAAGMNGGVSMGVRLSEELLRAIRAGGGLGDEEAMALLSRGLGLDVSGALEVSDRQAFRDAAATATDIVKDPAYAAILAESGMSFEMRRSVGVEAGMPYDAYAYSFSAVDGSDLAESGAAAAAARLVGRLVSPVYLYKDDKAFIGLGSAKAAAAAVPLRGAKKPLRADKAFKALRAGAPADARALMYVSTRALARLAMSMMPENRGALGFDANALSGLLSWFDASPGAMGFGVGIGAEDVKAIVAIADR